MKRLSQIGLGILFTALMATQAWGQGVLIVVDPPRPTPLPRPFRRPIPPPTSYKIKELTVQSRIKDQVAQVQVSQSFVNTGSRQMEVCFVFPLPYDGAVDRLTFMVDGKEYEAKLLPAKEARSIYEGYIRRNQDPALLEWMGTGMFKTSVFPVPPGAERTVSLRYSQLLRKDHRLTDFLFPLSTAKYTSQPVENILIQASIESSVKIKSVYSPTHSINVKRPDDRHAVIEYKVKNETPSSDFRLFFDTSKDELGASVVSYRPDEDQDGYFLLLASPDIKQEKSQKTSKTVVIVIDRSGSMAGKKIEQAKEAIRFVVNNLQEGDLFNIVAYDSSVESFQPELQKYDEETRKAAMGFVEGIYAGGSTNIEGALSSALAMIPDSSHPGYVIFLTDGRPTAGETNEAKIVVKAEQLNKNHSRLVSFGVGYDVNSRLLDRLSHQNYGQSQFVRPDEDIESHVSQLYNRISAPVLTEVEITFDLEKLKEEDGKAVNRVYPGKVHDLFAGEQLVLVGRYRRPGQAKVVVRGKVGDKKQKMDFPADLVKFSGDQTYAFVEKLWAMRRIGEIINEIDLHGKNSELVEELVSLSTKHGILTPYTSFLADDLARPGDLANRRSLESEARTRLSRLQDASGVSGFAQRAEKKALREANQVPRAIAGGRSNDGGAGGASSSRGAATRPLAGLAVRDIDKDEITTVDSVRMIGNETLYKRGKLWIASNATEVDIEKDAAKIKSIKRFGDEYFELVKKNTPSENAVLSQQQNDEELLIKLRGVVYRIL